MKVKVGNKLYDAELQPVMVILEGNDKANIAQMTKEATKYCSYPDDADPKEILKWMRDIPHETWQDICPNKELQRKRPKPTPRVGY